MNDRLYLIKKFIDSTNTKSKFQSLNANEFTV
jgi:hypothetical protein